MRVPMALLAGAAFLAPAAVLAQSTTMQIQRDPNANQNWTYEQNAAMPNGRIYPGDIYGPTTVIVTETPSAQSRSDAPARMPHYSMGAQSSRDVRDPAVVTAVQRALNQRGYNLPEDGLANTDTRNALVAYQSNTGLNPSGAIDAATLAALNVQVSQAALDEATPTVTQGIRGGASPR